MSNDCEIGRVVAVDTARVTIELNDDLKALTRGAYEGVQDIARINSYVIIPAGAHRLVAIVTRVTLTEEAQITPDRTSVTLPSARRLVYAVLIGTIDGTKYEQGISLFPALDSPVCMVSKSDLDVIFDQCEEETCEVPNPEKPGYCIRIGDSAVFAGFPIRVDPDRAFGKHLAILGSTGSGKSCTVATLLQSILEMPKVKRTNFVILDTNGEYASAFLPRHKYQHIPSDPKDLQDKLIIPYWFMNSEDFVRMFRAKEGLQAPVLLRALRLSRAGGRGDIGILSILESLRMACIKIDAIIRNDNPQQQWAIAQNIHDCCIDSLKYRTSFPNHVQTLIEKDLVGVLGEWETKIGAVKRLLEPTTQSGRKTYPPIGGTTIQQIQDLINPVLEKLNEASADYSGSIIDVSADQPIFFGRNQFIENSLETAMHEQSESGSPGRIRDACGPMFLRIRRYFEDPRFKFLFGMHPDAANVLAAFIRDVLGLQRAEDIQPPLDGGIEAEKLPFYCRQRDNGDERNIVIVDLSLLASEVLENVTALIGRLILEFLQHLSEFDEHARGSLPTVLILEEAQNYIREGRSAEDDSISKEVFERISREGRKFGLGLVVCSQRPSELSKTVLSQCSSFIVHRLQNPEDLKYFKDIVPGVYEPLLQQLPALSPQTALVLGEWIKAPALVRIREANPLPRSKDPKFYSYWVRDDTDSINVEAICGNWEGRTIGCQPKEKADCPGSEGEVKG